MTTTIVLAVGTLARVVEEREKERRTRVVLAEVRRAYDRFRVDVGRCPRSMRELVHPPRTGTRYLRDIPVDGWGRRLEVFCPGLRDPDSVDVISAGPSGSFAIDDNVQ